MRTFVQKPKAIQQTTSAKSPKHSRSFVGQNRDVHSILHLQRAIGNQAVLRLLETASENIDMSSANSIISTGFSHDFSRVPVYPSTCNNIQPKLKVNAPRDQYEQEADRAADKVLRQKMHEEEVETIDIQARPSLPAAGGEQGISKHLENQLNRSSSTGSPLARATQSFFEPRMRHDFDNVRIHTDDEAVQLNRVLRAQAFTRGRDIYFGAGGYNPQSGAGARLLAHELTHVVQQTGPSPCIPAGITQRNGPARTINFSYLASSQNPVQISLLGRPRLQRYREAGPSVGTSGGSESPPSWYNRAALAGGPVEDAARELWRSNDAVDRQTARNLFNGNPPVYFSDELRRSRYEGHYYLPDRRDPDNLNVRISVRMGGLPSGWRGTVLWGREGQRDLPYIIIHESVRNNEVELENALVHEMNHAARGRRTTEEPHSFTEDEPSTRDVDASWSYWQQLREYQSEFDAHWVSPDYRELFGLSRARAVRERILDRYRSIREAYDASRAFRRLARRYGRRRYRRGRESERLSNEWPSWLAYSSDDHDASSSEQQTYRD